MRNEIYWEENRVPTQIFETTVVLEDGETSGVFISVPWSRSRFQVRTDLEQVAEVLGVQVLRPLAMEEIVPAMALTLATPADAAAAALGSNWSPGEQLSDASERLIQEALVVTENSPPELSPLSTVLTKNLTSGVAMGALAGLVSAWGTPLVLITVPGGIILGGAAEGVAHGLRRGLRKRIERWALGRK